MSAYIEKTLMHRPVQPAYMSLVSGVVAAAFGGEAAGEINPDWTPPRPAAAGRTSRPAPETLSVAPWSHNREANAIGKDICSRTVATGLFSPLYHRDRVCDKAAHPYGSIMMYPGVSV
ncbi:hypothetical protein [Labedaea rhizosphaerae]|uniref:hypothetical protein n=1 Tax=Labedaea rhizosphaerae TaxID=598644 RepID=UPI00105D98E7|nr:hypothetical protein [Labedaea rhizosphaerae]